MIRNVRKWAFRLTGTIFEDKRAKSSGFLDPWTSLLPDFLREKLNPDILAIFGYLGNKLHIHHQLNEIIKEKMPFFALVFPKRSYLPKEFPHFQLWFLGRRFVPSLGFLKKKQRIFLEKIFLFLNETFDCFVKSNPGYKSCRKVYTFNATPFSFIKKADGFYFSGGQSVRTFHLHLLLPPLKFEKVAVKEKDFALTFPTDFSSKLFALIFKQKEIEKFVFGKKKREFSFSERGISFELKRHSTTDLMGVLYRVDKIMQKLQLILIFSFYKDSHIFLKEVARLKALNGTRVSKLRMKKLILVGKERLLGDIKNILEKELKKFAKSYRINFKKSDLENICQSLVLDENGDLASFIQGRVVVLRPGMGYGCFVEDTGKGFGVKLSPLDTLSSKGVMEASGFLTVKRETVSQKPLWLRRFKLALEKGLPSLSPSSKGKI